MILKNNSSSSSKSTLAFDTSSIYTNNSKDNYLNKNNFNRNAYDINENLNKKKKYSNRLIQSLTDITTNDLYSSINRENSHGASRIESALMTSDYSHLLTHSIINTTRPIFHINMNRTIEFIKRNGAGDENISSYFNDKQVQTPTIIDNNHYLTLEQVPIYNRRIIHLTSKQLIFISISIFIFVILLCLIMIFFYLS